MCSPIVVHHHRALLLPLLLHACSFATDATEAGMPTATDATTAISGADAAVCGDEQRDGTEVCDGPDLAGQTCSTLPGLAAGALACRADCSDFDTSACTPASDAPRPRFNEVVASDVTQGVYAGAGDAIELFNPGAAAIDLSGARLSDDAEFPAEGTYVFPEGSQLAAGAWLVLTKRDEVAMTGEYPFGISASKPEHLLLVDATGTTLDEVMLVGGEATTSWCRIPDGDGPFQSCAQTLGAANRVDDVDDDTSTAGDCGDGTRDSGEICDGDDLGGLDCTDVSADFGGGMLACSASCQLDTQGCVLVGAQPLVLNELRASGDDAIELYNAGARPIALGGWILTDALSRPDGDYDPTADDGALVFGDDAVLQPGEFLVVEAGDPPGHPFGSSQDGDHVALLDPTLVVVDLVAWTAGAADTSYCRVPDGPGGAWQADCTETLGDHNEG
jgi:hypothetical protein